MRIKAILTKPGTIMCWRSYNIFKRIVAKLRGETLPYNKFTFVIRGLELLTLGCCDLTLYEPVHKYTKAELKSLCKLYGNSLSSTEWADIKAIANVVRPNTFAENDTIDSSKEYKRRNINDYAIKHIYSAK